VAQAIYIQSVHEEFGTIYLEGVYFKPNGQQISGVFGDIHGVSLMLICSVTDGVYSVDRGGFRNEEIDGYLTKTNTESWTPTGDYNPATKKYVDDSLANLDVDVETTETVIFSSADTKEQRKEKFFHLVELYNSGKKFNTFFKCNASVSVLGSSFKPAMPLYGFLYDLSFDRSGSYSYKYAMCFLVKYADGNMQSVGDSFAKIELFSESNDPAKGYHEQLVCADNNYCYYLPRKHELITKNYVDTAIANAITTVLEGGY
jgi:hypothetical protein